MSNIMHKKWKPIKDFVNARSLKNPKELQIQASINSKENPYKRIQTERLRLRPWSLKDVNDLVECLNDFEVAKNLVDIPFPFTTEDAFDFIKKANENKSGSGTTFYAIEHKNDGKVIGGTSIVIEDYDAVGKEASGNLWLNSAYQGQGYAAEARYARIKFCFDVLKVNHILSSFVEDNEASWKMQQQFGTEIYDKRKRFYMARNQTLNSLKTILTKESFLNNETYVINKNKINTDCIKW